MDALREQLQDALGDSYRIDRELSGGGMSRLFIATERSLERTGGNKGRAAKLLNLKRTTLVEKLKRLDKRA